VISTVVKDRVGRHRYVVFRVEGGEDLEMGDVIGGLREAFASYPQEARPWLVLWRGGKGVVRCAHVRKDDVIHVLRSIRRIGGREVRVETLGTSGTVRKAVRKYIQDDSSLGRGR
jgi:RNase P/RNase MRP subunit POP5